MLLYEVQLATLVPIGDDGDERRQRYCKTSEQLLAYLAGAPAQSSFFFRQRVGNDALGLPTIALADAK